MKTISVLAVRAGLVAISSLFFIGAVNGAISVDATAFGNQGTAKTTVSTSSFSTTSANELLLAFISADQVSSSSTTVTKITGGGLTWVLVQRTNTQRGTAEIWRAFATTTLTGAIVTATLSQSVCSSITVMSFTGVDTTGTNGSGAIGMLGTGNANPGLPTASLTTSRNGSLVVGVGNDWDNAIARTVPAGQTLVHQYFPPVGDTYWVQMETSTTPLSGTTVTINDTAPGSDRYNLSTVEVLAASGGTGSTFTVSGTINPTTAGTGTTVTLSQGSTVVATTSATSGGTYSFSNIANGTYTVTPTNSSFSFSPANQSVIVNGGNATVPVFNATAVTFTVSGTISPTTAGTGTTVTLTQGATTVATTSATGSGTYSFSNIANGTYTVTPTNSAFTFSPTTQSVTVNGGPATVPVFNATAVTFTVSGTISPSTAGTGTTVTLTQGSTVVATTSATGSGTYSFSNIANGTYTVTPTNSAFTFSPTTQSVTVNGGPASVPVFNATAVTFTVSGTISPTTAGTGTTVTLTQGTTTVATTSATGSGTYSFSNIANGTYTVTPTNSAFTFSPTTQSVTVSGGPATVPVFNATAVTFTVSGTISPTTAGTGTTVALTQGTTTIATTSATGSGTYSFSNIANGTYTVTPSNSAFTFSPTTQSVTVSGGPATVPVFNATAVTFTVSGTISPTTAGTGTTVTLTQGTTTVATTSATGSGTYSFSNIANGTYTVTPTNSAFTFSPTTQSVTVSGGPATVPVFNATAVGFAVSGTISPISAGTGTTMTLSQNGTTVATTSGASDGTYNFSNIPNGTYTVTPTNGAFSFNPASQPVTVSGGPATVPVFNATAASTFSVSGSINPAAGGTGTTVTLSQNGTTVATAAATSGGIYVFANIANGTYTVTPTNNAYNFGPSTQSVVVSGAPATVPAFTATSTVPLLFPDLQDILPPAKMSIVQTANGRQFQYTHDTLDAGPGPLVIQPVFNAASGTYQGTQYIYSQNANGSWSLIQQLPIGGAFIFDSDHGHFHFPFVTYGLYAVAADGGPGVPMAVSAKVSFCINDSFIFEPNIPNAGQLGNLGSCSDPTSLRGLDIGAVDEYDETDAGQSISINNLPDGTYWLRAVDDPNNFLFEADKTNNETDVELTITGTTLQVLKTVVPVINNPPSVSLTSPSGGATVSKTVQLTASTATTSGVQYLVDGQSFGSLATTPPYAVSWDTTTVPDGTHWIAAQTTDATGVIGTSPVALVTVDNAAVSGPTVQLSSPTSGSIVSATVSLYAQVGGSLPIQSVSFFVDFVQIGSPLTAPPYIMTWDTTTVPDGQHTITVSATDSQGNVGNSAPVTLDVNNSHPANLIGKDVSVSADGHDAITTAVFSTATPSDLLIAFVSYDGPSGGGQGATVTGAGLSWALLERSNTQLGTAEIWSARADGLLSAVTVTSRPNVGTGYHGSLTVIAFTNAAGTSVVGRTGAPSGAPDIPLPGVIAGDWVFAVGNDWDNPIARVPVSGQVLVHQKVDTAVGDTYWVQSTTVPSPANALVDIHDSSPTTDQWNYAAVEIVATHQ